MTDPASAGFWFVVSVYRSKNKWVKHDKYLDGWASPQSGTSLHGSLSRYVIPGQPQHIIQRGNNRQAIFAAESDYSFFRDAMFEAAERFGVAIHAYVW
jgi:hypothetical protein